MSAQASPKVWVIMALKLSSPDGFGKTVQSERVVRDAIAAILQGPTGVRIGIGRTSGEGRDDRLGDITTNVFLGESAQVVKPLDSKASIVLGGRERNCCAAYALAACFSITAVKDTAVAPLYVGVRGCVGRESSWMMTHPAGITNAMGEPAKPTRAYTVLAEEHIGCWNDFLTDERTTRNFYLGSRGSSHECVQ